MIFADLKNIILAAFPDAALYLGRKSLADLNGGEVLENKLYFYVDIEGSGTETVTAQFKHKVNERYTLIALYKDNTDNSDEQRAVLIEQAAAAIRIVLKQLYKFDGDAVPFVFNTQKLLNVFSGYFVGSSANFTIQFDATAPFCKKATFEAEIEGDAQAFTGQSYDFTVTVSRTDTYIDASNFFAIRVHFGDGQSIELRGEATLDTPAVFDISHTYTIGGNLVISISGKAVATFNVEVLYSDITLEPFEFMQLVKQNTTWPNTRDASLAGSPPFEFEQQLYAVNMNDSTMFRVSRMLAAFDFSQVGTLPVSAKLTVYIKSGIDPTNITSCAVQYCPNTGEADIYDYSNFTTFFGRSDTPIFENPLTKVEIDLNAAALAKIAEAGSVTRFILRDAMYDYDNIQPGESTYFSISVPKPSLLIKFN